MCKYCDSVVWNSIFFLSQHDNTVVLEANNSTFWFVFFFLPPTIPALSSQWVNSFCLRHAADVYTAIQMPASLVWHTYTHRSVRCVGEGVSVHEEGLCWRSNRKRIKCAVQRSCSPEKSGSLQGRLCSFLWYTLCIWTPTGLPFILADIMLESDE